jgi:hypothetical protein
MNLKLQHVFSDIDGVSAQAIINAILAGERDAVKLAALRDKRCKSSAQDIIEALRGDYREEYLFVFRQSQQTYQQLRAAIATCDEKLGELAARVERPLKDGSVSPCMDSRLVGSPLRTSAISASPVTLNFRRFVEPGTRRFFSSAMVMVT